MTRVQRRVHLWGWAVLGTLMAIGLIAGLCVRPRVTEAASVPTVGTGR